MKNNFNEILNAIQNLQDALDKLLVQDNSDYKTELEEAELLYIRLQYYKKIFQKSLDK